MDFVWVVQLILVLISSGQCHAVLTQQTSNECLLSCPPGEYKENGGNCANSGGKFKCKKCESGTFTAVHNSVGKCQRCGDCARNEVIVQKCLPDSDIRCDCRDGSYYDDDHICTECPGAKVDCLEASFSEKCRKNEDFKRKCASNAILSSKAPRSKTHVTTETIAPDHASTLALEGMQTVNNPTVRGTEVPEKQHMTVEAWPLLVVAAVLFATFLVCMLLCLKTQTKCHFWSVNKDLETHVQHPKFKEGSTIISASFPAEQHSHGGTSPATVTFDIPEETPMIPLHQESPAHVSHHMAERQDEHRDQWPAIVLYAIIKEVPLRRWKEFLRLLSMADQQMERVELEAGLDSTEKQYQMLRLWSQHPSASLDDIYSSLHYMDLSGCAQLLQERLEKLQWKPEEQQGCTV
ncbi:unnamed protein product [Menidia menidia]|uniref:(Atlantic silverside) hypothetical protein n=1 Tax=Menidia menidia TaxID=238744 RepID=A0A8S4BSR0_9TELE|nr:unnamed protein product [Menidia menidia]